MARMGSNSNQSGEQGHNNVPGNRNHYERGLEFAEAGKHQEALACMQEHLRITGGNAQVLNDTGAILHCLGRSEEAIEHFIKARRYQTDSIEILWNLAEAYLAVGKAKETMQLFDNMEQLGILNVDVVNRTANLFVQENNKADAIEILIRSLRIWPNQEILKPMIEVIRHKRPKIAFFCGLKGDTKFLTDICTFTERRFPVRFFDGDNIEQVQELMEWSDISWFEWCTNLAVEASKLPKVCKNIVRLHRFEAYGDWPSQVQWENIDTLITVGNSFVKESLAKQVPNINNRTRLVTIPNGVNLDKFKFIEKQRGKNIACVGYLNMRKNPMLLLQCMQKLHYIDSEYKLFFAGVFQNPMLEQYVRHIVQQLELTDVVFFDGWQEDINFWLEDKHYIVSGSIGESQGMGIMEGMALGLKPVIHNFPGANQIFPSEFLFNIAEEFCNQILSDNYQPKRYRRFIDESYPLKNQLTDINNIFTQFESEIDSQQTVSAFSNNLQNLNLNEIRFPTEVSVPSSDNNLIV
ncbi:MAG: tetratricopeptide repeat-containing glycosyltransferase family protein [Sedimentisphaerales bacterium]|nr:tetratricopeptide repeat-containing glycosyltransferase family protein [Sedimentisphaerales bacterium]